MTEPRYYDKQGRPTLEASYMAGKAHRGRPVSDDRAEYELARLERERDEALARIVVLTTTPSGRVEPPEEPPQLCVEQAEFVTEFNRSGSTNTPVDGRVIIKAHQWYCACANRAAEVRRWGHSWRWTAMTLETDLLDAVELLREVTHTAARFDPEGSRLDVDIATLLARYPEAKEDKD